MSRNINSLKIMVKQKVDFKQIKHKIKKYKNINEEDIPLGILYYMKLRKIESDCLVDLNDKSLDKVRMDIWRQCWEQKLLKHKKQRRREKVIIDGDLY